MARYFLLLLLCAFIGRAAELSPPEIAARATAATVGVYSRLDDEDRYYGSGVVVTADGYILTSTSVVPPAATAIEIYFADHTRSAASIVEVLPHLDTVLLKTARENLAYLPSAKNFPTLGEAAFAVGNANNTLKLGDGAAFSAGLVSGIYAIPATASNSPNYRGKIIETDCAINPGQDGGALVNARAEIIGIISRAVALTRWQGVAVPMAEILPALNLTLTPPEKSLPVTTNFWGRRAEKFFPALVALEITREYPPEIIVRQTWTEFRRGISDWEKLSESERRRIIADFFAADSVLAANQMIRRPAGKVSGVLISSRGHLITSAFNVQAEDRVFTDTTRRVQLPPYCGNLATMLATSHAELETINPLREITATLADGRSTSAKIICINHELGVALLQIPLTEKITYLDLTLSGTPQTGEAVALLGASPATINRGIVSAIHAEGKFQIDAWVNYANSGGLIISQRGRFLGIATTPIAPSPLSGRLLPFTPSMIGQASLADYTHCPNSGIGFAVPASAIMEMLKTAWRGEL